MHIASYDINYITLHSITLHYITSNDITLHVACVACFRYNWFDNRQGKSNREISYT